ncbi:MAG: hypothetical protein ACRDQ7_11915 [Haloechinothrix sp.]
MIDQLKKITKIAALDNVTVLACLERACHRLISEGWQVDALADGHLGDLPESPERDSLLRRRAELGVRTDLDAPLCSPCRRGDDVHCGLSAFPGIDSDGGLRARRRQER